jgi:hypothetical protein
MTYYRAKLATDSWQVSKRRAAAHWPRRLRRAAVAVVAMCTVCVRADPASGLTLYHRFAVGTAAQWSSASVPLRPSEWAVGRPDGPAASADQMREVLESLSLVVIGCNCRGTNVGPTHYPCVLELRRPQVDTGSAPQDDMLGGWWSTSAETLTRIAAGVVEAGSVSDRNRASDVSLGLPDTVVVAADYLGLVAPKTLRERLGSPQATALTFETYAHPSELGTTPVDGSTGLVILSTQRPKPVPPAPPAAGSA